MDKSLSIPSHKKTSLVSNRPFRLLWIGQTLSLTGDSFFAATMTIWIIDRLARGASWLPLATGAVAISVVLPSLVVSPLAGVWVDRWNSRWTMIWTDGLRTGLVALFLVLTLLVSDRTLLLLGGFAALLLVASGQQFFLPARVVVVADLVPEEQHGAAYGSLQQAAYLAQILGPTLAVPLYFVLGPTWAILLDVLSFLLSLLSLLRVRVQEQHPGESQPMGFWSELREGLSFFVTNRVLVTLLISGMIFMFGGMVYNSFEYLYGVENLHVPEVLLGLYVACFGIGVVGGLPLIVALAKRFSEVEVLWLCLIVHGLALLVLSRMTTLLPGILCVLVMGVTQASVFVAVRPLTVLVTPRALIGRVMSFEGPMITVASLVGGMLASTLASTVLVNFHARLAGMSFGPLDTLLAASGVLIVAGGVYARLTLYRAVKHLRATAEAPQHEVEPQQ
ncbi:MAG TPA: MFS transporter [Ktedonosporobacter sp.]|nr:MFS transporter [Ktedonosporobacter sp.]